MKKRILSAFIAGVIVISSVIPAVTVSAAPVSQEVTDARAKYEELQVKVAEIEDKIMALNVQIEPLVEAVNKNKAEISNINKEVENTNKEIEQAKVEIGEKEEILGDRLRELYKSGGQSSYISLLFSAESFSDLISKVDSAGRLVNLDKKVVAELQQKKDKLDEKITSLEVKAKEVAELNVKIEKELAQFEDKKKEQDVLIAQAASEREAFDKTYLADIERDLVATQIATCRNSGSSINDLKSAIAQLRSIRDNQIKSPTIKEEINSAIENAKVLVSRKEAEEKAASDANRGETVAGNVQGVLNVAYAQLGKPYVWGATGPSTFDCSGLTSYAYRHGAGIEIGRTTWDQLGSGKTISSKYELQPGDLVFTRADMGHVGIYIGGGNMIHAPRPGKNVEVSSVYAFYTARRIMN